MNRSSLLNAVRDLAGLMTRGERSRCLWMALAAALTSVFEAVTAVSLVILARAITAPEHIAGYLEMAGIPAAIAGGLSQGRLVFYLALGCGLLFLVKNLMAAGEIFYQNFSIQGMHYRFNNRLLERYAAAGYATSLTRGTVKGLTVITHDTDLVFNKAMVALAAIVSESIVFAVLGALVVFINPLLAAVLAVSGAVTGYGLLRFVLPLFYGRGKRLHEADVNVRRHLLQFFQAFKDMILYGKSDALIEAYREPARQKARLQALQETATLLPRLALEAAFVAIFIAVIAVMCLKHDNPGKMIGTLGGYLYAGFRLMPGLNRLISNLNIFKANIPAIESIRGEYVSLGEQSVYRDTPDFSFENSLRLENISYRHPGGNSDILSGVTLEIRKGECIGIIGESGSGKSTLADLILGLVIPDQGQVLIDDRFPAHSRQWHQRIGYVGQNIFLTDDTIAANIAFGEHPEDIDPVRLKQAIKDAQLDSLTAKLPDGVNARTGEQGSRLSGGERQRIAIARALYRQPEVLVFDEATSALDTVTEAKLTDTIRAIGKTRTVIMIAHRLTTLKDCDRLIKVENGMVFEHLPG